MTARALAERVLYTTAPVSRRRTTAARWIGRFCATLLIVAGCYSAATATWSGDLVAAFAIASGVWCWRHQRAMATWRCPYYGSSMTSPNCPNPNCRQHR